MAEAPRPTAFIPNLNGGAMLPRTLESLRRQTRPVDVVLVDNGSSDGSVALARERFEEVEIMELGANLGFGPAINRAVAEREAADPVIVLNNDIECEPEMIEAMLEVHSEGADSVAAVLLQEREPGLIDSAGVVADETLMGFDHLHGEPAARAEAAPDPLGPTGGAALYSRAAFDAVGGFDERIFLYYEDLDLALRMAAAGGRCRLAAGARAVHAYSASLGAGSGEKYARTGWSRGYMLRRYGVMRSTRRALRALACEAALCAGQLLLDRTGRGVTGRLEGWHAGGGLEPRGAGGAPLLEISARDALRRRRGRRG
jgi:GT2 family glycosyltransferase